MLLLAVIVCVPAAYGLVNVPTKFEILEYLPPELESAQGSRIIENTPMMELEPSAILLITAEEIDEEILSFEDNICRSLVNGRNVEYVAGFTGYYRPDNRVTENMLPFLKPLLKSENMTFIAIHFKPLKKIELEEFRIESKLRTESLRNIEEQFRDELPEGAEMYLTGEMVLTSDMVQVTKEDRARITVVAGIGIGIALVSLLASLWAPIALAIAIGLAIFWNFGFCFWWPGSIDFLTFAVAAALQLGVTVDYGFYLTTRYREERKIQKKKEKAMTKTLAKTSRAIVGAASTTIIAFGAVGIARFGVISNFGLILARGIFLSFLAATVVFPSMLLVSEPMLRRLSRKGFRE